LSVSCNKSHGRALRFIAPNCSSRPAIGIPSRAAGPSRHGCLECSPSTNHRPKEHAMNTSLPATPVATRINALAAALVVTLAMLSGIDVLASAEGAPSLIATGAAAESQRG
jgi:hypothetical protein